MTALQVALVPHFWWFRYIWRRLIRARCTDCNVRLSRWTDVCPRCRSVQ